ncbi:HNH endonuclease signature motif containing protein, partial [Streptomyces hydrogenans]|uniref:HNH endonuclease signature motif containing protein n=1 Tax=Streptomyces hydrogenans TaxID=1873719 RepID=UPI0036455E24
MSETWKEHPSATGYFVSDSGQVRGRRGGTLSPHSVLGGYQRVKVAGKNRLVHVLVAEAFIGPKSDGGQVNHKDGNTANNALSNLEYVTPSANVRHSLDVLGVRRAKGSRNGQSRLDEKQVAAIRATFARGGNHARRPRQSVRSRPHHRRAHHQRYLLDARGGDHVLTMSDMF